MVHRRRPLLAVCCLVLCCFLESCGSTEQQLERVAKDWCLTIRASQVIPVYPLSEDLRPGDVFIVELPVQRQAEIYQEKGFLPLDRHVTRLDGIDYEGMYEAAYFGEKFDEVPKNRGHRPEGKTPTGGRHPLDVDAPRAAFPSYSFEIDQKSGMNLAIPLQGLMLGFGFMQAQRATGSVQLKEAFTYGAPADDLLRQLKKWQDEPDVQYVLSALRDAVPAERDIFLRVVSRVYLVGGVDVALLNADRFDADASWGKATTVDLAAYDPESPKAGAAPEAAQNVSGAAALNEAAEKALPGVAVAYSLATKRTVTMNESFENPLVIGYVGFDLPILSGGRLGPPIATLAQLDQDSEVERVDQRSAWVLSDQEKTGTSALSGLFDLAARVDPDPAKRKEFISDLAKAIKTLGLEGLDAAVEKARTSGGGTTALESLVAAFGQNARVAANDGKLSWSKLVKSLEPVLEQGK